MLAKQQKRHRRHKKIRAKIKGTFGRPRFCIFRSNKHIYAQLINDERGEVLLSVSDLDIKKIRASKKTTVKDQKKGSKESKKEELSGKIALAYEIGSLIAKSALTKKIEKVIFDRGGYKYHGRVKALAQGAREGGLKF